MYICVCKGITDKQVKEASLTKKYDDFINETGICCACGVCEKEVKEIFEGGKQRTL